MAPSLKLYHRSKVQVVERPPTSIPEPHSASSAVRHAAHSVVAEPCSTVHTTVQSCHHSMAAQSACKPPECLRQRSGQLAALLTTLLTRPQRYFADNKRPDQIVLPGSQSETPLTNAEPPKLATLPTAPASEPELAQPIPKTPPTPEQVNANIPPTGTGTASVAPPVTPLPPPPKRKPRRFRRFLSSLLILSTLGYAGGVYYSLVSDNFHDFFTEYIPFGEDSVAYFEEREYRKRFPTRGVQQKAYPQIRGENKVTIGKSSGESPRVAGGSDLGQKGRHVSAVEDSKPQPAAAQQNPSQAAPNEKTKAVEAAKKDAKPAGDTAPTGERSVPKAEAKPAPAPASTNAAPAVSAPSAPAATLIDHVTVPNAAEPVVQAAVKLVNDLITVINSDPNASKYQTTLTSAKSQLSDIISSVGTLKEQVNSEATKKITDAHKEFDTAAKELVSRLEKEMQAQEMHWREEYENEREKLSHSYQAKLSAELDVVRKLAEERSRSAIIEKEILLNRQFSQDVRDRVESERNGRLSKLEELSTSVSELEKLTGDWNKIVDANLATQHLHVALESVRAAIARQDHPTPFINELAALREIGNGNEVVNAAIASIPPVAYQRGVPTPAHLIDRYRRVASEVRKAALLPEDAGVASHAASAVLSKFLFSKKGEGLPEGNDVEAVLTRTEVLLEEGDLDGAAREMNGLQGWAGVLSKDWVSECRRVLETKQALEVSYYELPIQTQVY